MLGTMLGAHPACLVVPESRFKTDVLRARGIPATPEEVLQTYRMIGSHSRFWRWGLVSKLVQTPPQKALGSYSDLLRWLVEEYGKSADKRDGKIWVDHTTTNTHYLSTLFKLFPDAKAIHIIRDGRAVAASIMPLDWGPNTVIAAAYWWCYHVSFGLAAESALGKDRVARVRYEDLVSSPEEEMKRLCIWLGLDFHPRMIKGGSCTFPIAPKKYHPLIEQAPQPSRIHAWQETLTSPQIETFESRTHDLLGYLGYEVSSMNSRVTANSVEFVRTMTVEPVKILVNYFRFRISRARQRRLLITRTSQLQREDKASSGIRR